MRGRPAISNENDENSGTARLTRAKAAALAGDENTHVPVKKALASKKSVSSISTNAQPLQRKRAALGDVSNVTKNEPTEAKDGKKATVSSKAGLVSKASQAAGVQKLSRQNSGRAILGAKDANKKTASNHLKRQASGSGVLGGVAKKRASASTGSLQSVQESIQDGENVPPNEQARVTEVKKSVTVVSKEEYIFDDGQPGIHPKEAAPSGVPDLDADDGDDPLMVAEYVWDIFGYMYELEETTMANPDYMDQQDGLEWHLRGVLVDWLIEVHQRFHLLPETLFLAVNIIDRFLSMKVVQLDKLQLVGVTAMFIASKYEEVLSPHVQNFKHVADDGFSEEEILGAERYMLGVLQFNLSYPNPLNFLRRISKADNYDVQTRTLGKYLLEISLLDHRFIEFKPSHVAAASMYVARAMLEKPRWVCLCTGIFLLATDLDRMRA